MKRRRNLRAWVIAGCFLIAALPALADSKLKPFAATYNLSRGGIILATVEVTLRLSPAGRYRYQARTIPTAPVAVFRDDEITELSEGRLSEEGIYPDSYLYHHRNPKKSRRTDLDFDWAAGRVTNRTADSHWSMEIQPGTQDKFSQQLLMMMTAAKGMQEIEFPVADGGRLKQYRFQTQGWEEVSTEAGTFHSLKLARSKNHKPSRASYWLAPELNYLPVKVERLETDESFIMQLRSLSWH